MSMSPDNVQTPIPEEPNENNVDNAKQPEKGKKTKEYKKISVAAAVIIALLLCIITFAATYSVTKIADSEDLAAANVQIAKYSKLKKILGDMTSDYVRGCDESEMLEAAYKAILESVDDPYTYYMTAEEYADFMSNRAASYDGIGISIVLDPVTEAIYIYRVIPGSPAEKAGLKAKDLITDVDGIHVTKSTYNEAVLATEKEAGTTVNLTVLRNGSSTVIPVTLGNVPSVSVWYEKLDDGIAYITITSFAGAYVTDQFSDALKKASEDGCTSYLFDVRGNPGGSLDVICKVLDMLLPEGPIVHVISADGTDDVHQSDAEHFLSAPMAVLCNKNTASAAELFTADLRDYKLATIVGTTTHGKGTVQTVRKLYDGSAIKITTDFYNPASNTSYDKIGIVPDIEISLSQEQTDNFYLLSPEEDPQLQAAIQALKQ